MRWDVEWTQVIPNIAESWEVSEDGTTFTFTLREGMKWSDGHPFTADDIMFWYEDVVLNQELSPTGPPSYMIIAEESGTVEKLDNTTVRFTFPAANGLFLQTMATTAVELMTLLPRHYLEQFHARYNPDIDALVQQANLEDWTVLFNIQMNWMQNPDLPSLHAWVITTPYDGTTTRVVAERNPYYWKVDPEGNQLPYIEQVVYEVFGDGEVLLLRALAGEIDMQHRHLERLVNKPVLLDNAERGNYRLFDTIPDQSNNMSISFNLTHRDLAKREVFQNKDFRVGLSHAINRQEIIDLIYVGQGEPFQIAPRPDSALYNEQLARQYTEYDVDLANEHLDQVLPDKDAQGFRLGPDGQRFSFVIEVISADQTWIDVMGLVQSYWIAVGVDAQVRTIDRSLFITRRETNQHDAAVWGGQGGFGVILRPDWYFPAGGAAHNYAPLWVYWYQGDPRGEEPPAEVRRQMELYDQLRATVDEAEQEALMRQVLEITTDQFYAIGISLEARGFGVVKNTFHNVPASIINSFIYPGPAPTNPEQYFIEDVGR